MHGTCMKCRQEDLEVVLVRKAFYCYECFVIFTKSKYRRAMDAFRLGLPEDQKNVRCLIACSGGLASSVLVELAYAATMLSRGKNQMPIVLHIDDNTYKQSDDKAVEERLVYLQQTFTEMKFMHRSMDDISRYVSDTLSRSPSISTPTNGDSYNEAQHKHKSTLSSCLEALPSVTSQRDMLTLYRERLMLETANEEGCSAIIFGNSGTSLAAKTLSLTAKGRGYALPWDTADHSQSHSGIWSVRPLKGLFNAEIEIYARLTVIPSPRLPVAGPGKPDSIDELTQRYFESLEEQFPSLVATVVRTTNKLVEPVPRSQALGECKICSMTYREGARRWLGEITVNSPAHVEGEPLTTLESDNVDDHRAEDLCYGCVVAVRGAKHDVQWPVFKNHPRQNDTESVLNEFSLDAEEM